MEIRMITLTWLAAVTPIKIASYSSSTMKATKPS
jgi:hypothetical protein